MVHKLSPSLNSGLTLEGGELAEKGAWQVQLLQDLNLDVLSLKVGERRVGSLIPVRADLHLHGALQLHPRVEIAADLPLTILQQSSFERLAEQGFPQASPRAAGLGAPRLLCRLQLLRARELRLFSVAATAEVRFPVGDGLSFLSDRGFVFAPRLALEQRFGPVRAVANVGWRLRTAPGRFLNLYVGHEFTAGLGAEVDLARLTRRAQVRAWGELNLSTPAEAPLTLRDGEALKSPVELLAGVKARVSRTLSVTAGLGRGLGPPGYGQEAFRAFFGLAIGDEPGEDSDSDGIIDRYDVCPTEPESHNGFEDADGCPDAGDPLDGDGDGVPDAIDVCPTEAGPAELEGCPDRDGDQIVDAVDECPDTYGFAEFAGCPAAEAEPAVVLESNRIRLNGAVNFELGKANIDRRSHAILDDVVKLLTDNPQVSPVLVEGHTDDTGSRALNMRLSVDRAAAVVRYLVGKGIEAKRLRSAGFGPDRPVVPNTSPLNRARNRRTEFRIVEAGAEQPPKPKAR